MLSQDVELRKNWNIIFALCYATTRYGLASPANILPVELLKRVKSMLFEPKVTTLEHEIEHEEDGEEKDEGDGSENGEN